MDKWTWDDSKGHAYVLCYVMLCYVKTASNSVNMLLHHLNNTHSLT